ncbi:hypothetical protein SDC9_130089 [bioreactor metagenome]|uniref:Uncharacterized protein n=1 Tax=bioreactor metagenome TaxID=1076179 RepID=A0A645D0S0_9ZZZZ
MVDDEAKNQNQAKQGIGVDGFSQQVEHQEGQCKGDRNTEGGDQGVSHSNEEREDDHQESQTHQGIGGENREAGSNLYRRVIEERQGCPTALLRFIDDGSHSLHDGNRVSFHHLGNPEADGGFSIEAAEGAVILKAVHYLSNVTHPHQSLSLGGSAYDHIPDVIDTSDRTKGPEQVFTRIGGEVPAGSGAVLLGNRANHLIHTQSEAGERDGV